MDDADPDDADSMRLGGIYCLDLCKRGNVRVMRGTVEENKREREREIE